MITRLEHFMKWCHDAYTVIALNVLERPTLILPVPMMELVVEPNWTSSEETISSIILRGYLSYSTVLSYNYSRVNGYVYGVGFSHASTYINTA